MKNILGMLLLTFISIKGQSQDIKNLDFIIVVDENIAIDEVSLPSIKIVAEKNSEVFMITYYPGNLSIRLKEYEKILSDSTKSFFLCFNYDYYINGNHQIRNYEIELKKAWMNSYYNILRIYNLDRKEYSQMFNKSNGNGSYVYELDSPTHGFRLIRNRRNK